MFVRSTEDGIFHVFAYHHQIIHRVIKQQFLFWLKWTRGLCTQHDIHCITVTEELRSESVQPERKKTSNTHMLHCVGNICVKSDI